MLLTSTVPPMGGDNGNKTNPGIKNRGNHFASNAAPGVRKVYIFDAMDGDIIVSVIHNTINNTIQAPNCAGYAIFNCCNVILTSFSIMAKTIAPVNAFGNPLVVLVVVDVLEELVVGENFVAAPPRCCRCSRIIATLSSSSCCTS